MIITPSTSQLIIMHGLGIEMGMWRIVIRLYAAWIERIIGREGGRRSKRSLCRIFLFHTHPFILVVCDVHCLLSSPAKIRRLTCCTSRPPPMQPIFHSSQPTTDVLKASETHRNASKTLCGAISLLMRFIKTRSSRPRCYFTLDSHFAYTTTSQDAG